MLRSMVGPLTRSGIVAFAFGIRVGGDDAVERLEAFRMCLGADVNAGVEGFIEKRIFGDIVNRTKKLTQPVTDCEHSFIGSNSVRG